MLSFVISGFVMQKSSSHDCVKADCRVQLLSMVLLKLQRHLSTVRARFSGEDLPLSIPLTRTAWTGAIGCWQVQDLVDCSQST